MKIVAGGPNHGAEYPSDNAVENFDYNGFMVTSKKGFAPYEVKEFIEWTKDPGIVSVLCTDGVPRRIPTCQLTRELLDTFPERPQLDPLNGNGMLFGLNCTS